MGAIIYYEYYFKAIAIAVLVCALLFIFLGAHALEGFILTRESDGGREVFDGFGHSSRDGKLRAEPRGGFPVFRDKGGLFVVVVVVLLLLLLLLFNKRTTKELLKGEQT